VYPFQFQLDVDFALNGATLSVTSSSTKHRSGRDAGEHRLSPWISLALAIRRASCAHFIELQTTKTLRSGVSIRMGCLSPQRHPTPVSHRRLALDDALFRDDVVIFDQIRSRSVSYGADKGPRIRVSYPDARYLGVWTKPGAPFICIEPWQGIADEAGFTGDFSTKLGVFTLAPGAAQSLTMQIALLR